MNRDSVPQSESNVRGAGEVDHSGLQGCSQLGRIWDQPSVDVSGFDLVNAAIMASSAILEEAFQNAATFLLLLAKPMIFQSMSVQVLTELIGDHYLVVVLEGIAPVPI